MIRLLAMVLVVPTALLLFGCQAVDRTPPPSKPKLAKISPALLKPCPPLTIANIPEGDQDLIVALPFVRDDLENYKECRYRHGKLVAAVKSVYANQGQ